ncbi:MAG: mechanosensitive ion channel [Cyanothece sp. SIO2G6]|nr:mechanosensitive ion channel [Cyanothece sp. SIO2G6]
MPVITTAIIIAIGVAFAAPVRSQEEANGEGEDTTAVETAETAPVEEGSEAEASLPDTDSAAPDTLTIQDLTIPEDQLSLLVEPLTLEQLQVEADSWLYVLQAWASKVNQTEIASRQEGQLLDDMAAADQQLEQARTKLQELSGQEDAGEELNVARADVAAARREIARLRSRELSLRLDESFLEALADAEREQTISTATEVANDARQQLLALGDSSVVDPISEQVEGLNEAIEDYLVVQADLERVVPGTTFYRSLTRQLEQQREEVAMLLEEVEEISELDIVLPTDAELEEDLRLQLVADAARLAAAQPAIVSRLQIVLNEFARKGGDTEVYDNYIASVSGLDLDVTDAEGLTVKLWTWVQSEEGGIRVGINALKFVSIIAIAALLSPRIGNLSKTLLLRVGTMSSLFRDFTVMTIKRAVLAVGVILALASVGVNLGPILALIGGASFILAFALQSNLGNFASGLMLLVNKPFDVGDEVKVAGYWAYVDSISLANTKLKDFAGNIITLPNNTVWGGDIINYTHADIRKINIGINVKFGQDIDQIQDIWMSITTSNPKILSNPGPGIFPWGTTFDYQIWVGLGAWATTKDYWGVYVEVLKGLQKRLQEAEIELARPLQEIRVDDASGQPLVEQLPMLKETVDV